MALGKELMISYASLSVQVSVVVSLAPGGYWKAATIPAVSLDI
jgi:hypothetical protein